MSGSAPLVDWLHKNGVNKTLSVLLTYVLAISFFALLLFSILPPLIEETRQFVNRLPTLIDTFLVNVDTTNVPGVSSENFANALSSRLDEALSNVLRLILNAFSVFLSFITVAVFTFYLLLERDRIKQNLFVLLPNISKQKANTLAHKIEVKLGAWVRGEIFLMFIIGLTTYIGLTILGIEYALPLAVIAGLFELVPTVGPIISSIPAILLALVQSPVLAIAVAALYLLIQQAENNIIVPKVMEKAVGVLPLVTILSLLIGGTLFGVIGAVIAVPTVAMLQVIIEELVTVRKR
jgi:predicted PurR-regulated permease PerM